MRTGRLARTLVVLAVVGALTATSAQAAPPDPEPAAASPADAPTPPATRPTLPPTADEPVAVPAAEDLVTSIPEDERDATLGDGWEASGDQAWTLSGDMSGLHVLVADAADGYAWRTVASLSQPGVETDRWIGNACLTESGDRLVVAYGPRSFTNEPELFLQGAWTATVDLTDGIVTELPVRGSLEYFTPSCGHDEDAVLTVSGGEEIAATRLVEVDAETGTVGAPVDVAGQVTSAVPTDAGIVAAVGLQVARIDTAGHVTPLARTRSVPFELTTDADGGVVFLDHDGKTATARRLDEQRIRSPRPTTQAPAVAKGKLTELGVTRTTDGTVLLTGDAKATGPLPRSMRVGHGHKDAEVSSKGDVLVEMTSERVPVASVDGETDATAPLTTLESHVTSRKTGRTAVVDAVVDAVVEGTPATQAPGTGAETDRSDKPAASRGAARGTRLAAPGTSASALTATATAAATTTVPATTAPLATAGDGGEHDPVDGGRGCSVPRNSVENQALQPKPRQVEWAVNQAVKNVLTVQRPANWKNLGMPAYTPQGMFPPVALSGGGEVPSQIMLGILAQESNLTQANSYVVPGVTGSPLIGNYYGIDRTPANPDDLWNPDFLKVDCGYGISQVTDGMRLGQTGQPGGRSWNQQRAIALDYAANIAAGMQILATKWNQTRNAGLTINDGNPARIENWFFAVWAYNSGFYPEADKFTDNRNGAWGVGWSNNPANPSYKQNRGFFNENARDQTHPQDWPYPEKVLGFAAYPQSLMEAPSTYVAAYRAAWWPGATDNDANRNRSAAKPPVLQFCVTNFWCNSELGVNVDAQGVNWGYCWHKDATGKYDGRCWFNGNSTWKEDCTNTCGRSFLRFTAGYAYQEDGTAYPPACDDAGLPAGALVIDDVPKTAPVVRPGCTRPSGDAGTFTFTFSSGTDPTEYPSKMDLHQLGAGYGGHFWFGHTRNANLRNGSMEFSGEWKLNQPLHQWARVLVHVPDHGAHTRQATYIVDPGIGAPQARTILQRTMKNGWVSLGVFEINGVPTVRLSTETADGDLEADPGADGQWGTPDDTVLPAKDEDIAFDAVAFVPLPAKPQDIVVALGDSFSSGEGDMTYYPESDFAASDPRLRDGCHRSPFTWSRQATLPGSSLTVGARADSLDPTLDYHLLACSGAFLWHLNRNADQTARWGEKPQLDLNFLDKNTTLVTLSIGGNDAGFTDTFAKCFGPGECYSSRESDSAPTYDAVVKKKIKDVVGPGIVQTLQNIHGEAPNAKVMLMGYPELLSGQCLSTIMLSPAEIDWLNDLAGVLAAEMWNDVVEANTKEGVEFATFADPRGAFRGQGVCGSPQLINGPVLSTTNPSEIVMSATQSFHPNDLGYSTYADLMTRKLAEGATP